MAVVCPKCSCGFAYDPYFKNKICRQCGYTEDFQPESEFKTNFNYLKSIDDYIMFACVIFKQYVTLGVSHIKFVEWLNEPYNPDDFR